VTHLRAYYNLHNRGSPDSLSEFDRIVRTFRQARGDDAKSDLAYVVFHNHTSLASRLIQWWTFSRWSHAEIVIVGANGGTVSYGAHTDGGVRREFNKDYGTHWSMCLLDNIDTRRLHEFCSMEIGAPYDWYGLVCAQIFGASRESPDKYFCSEFVAAALADQGYPGFLSPAPARWAPGAIYKALNK
jgi:hypothetical protein